jgi:hypothetical protein
VEIQPLPNPMIFSSANREKDSGTHIGTVRFDMPGPEGTITTMELFKVLYSPNSLVNLISLGVIKQKGVIHDGTTDKLIVKETNCELTHIEWVNNVAVVPCYILPGLNINYSINQAILASINFRTMHCQLMYAPKNQLLPARKLELKYMEHTIYTIFMNLV